MAYRDWDQHDHRGTVRRREEQDDSWDYKKRRRYDDGDFYDDRGYRDDYRYDDGYQQNYGPGGGRSRGDDDWRTRQDDEQYDYHPKSHPKGKRMVASEATQHVIFLGLDPDFVEADLAEFVRSYGLGLESVTIIRDRNTGISTSSTERLADINVFYQRRI
ncbi:hypothetical protein FRB91_000212 [Serendipita sp. 411]|nr:hypothetical protein FRC15_009712 [Serendipita sp. 397]KAG8856874.1 hypothetical protein FRB91_000212 [Serendipita sp. 411]